MKQQRLLWLGALAGPLIWFASFGASFALAPWACTLRWTPALYIVSVAALALTAGAGLLSWNQWQQLGREYPGEAGGAVASSRALASGGVLLNGLFVLFILTQIVIDIMLGGCQ